jgi:hypothetical protein
LFAKGGRDPGPWSVSRSRVAVGPAPDRVNQGAFDQYQWLIMPDFDPTREIQRAEAHAFGYNALDAAMALRTK